MLRYRLCDSGQFVRVLDLQRRACPIGSQIKPILLERTIEVDRAEIPPWRTGSVSCRVMIPTRQLTLPVRHADVDYRSTDAAARQHCDFVNQAAARPTLARQTGTRRR